jgi:hypothetical protein
MFILYGEVMITIQSLENKVQREFKSVNYSEVSLLSTRVVRRTKRLEKILSNELHVV